MSSNFSSPFMAKSPLRQNEEEKKDGRTGRTQSEQNAANEAEKKKQVNNKGAYEAYKKAQAAKKAWEKQDPENFLKDYPGQEKLDSLKAAYKSKK